MDEPYPRVGNTACWPRDGAQFWVQPFCLLLPGLNFFCGSHRLVFARLGHCGGNEKGQRKEHGTKDASPVKSPSKAHQVLQELKLESREEEGRTTRREAVMDEMGRKVSRER